MTRALLITFLAMLCLAAPAQAKKPIVGFGEQNPQIFSDARWIDMKKTRGDIRYVMPWDALRYKKSRAVVDLWMDAAEYRHARVLLSFGHSNRRGRQLKLPTNKQFRRQIKAVRKRYPFVKIFQAWNEANQGLQPTFKKPAAAGRLYDVLVKTCRGCTVTSPSVLDDGMKTVRWIKAFDRAAKKKVKVWALHNHIDANRNTKSGTRLFLKATKRGQVWFTETGAIWNRWIGKRKIKRYTHKTAVRAIRNIFKLQRLNPRRVTRIYVYNWFGTATKRPRWDSGLIGANGKERKTFRTLRAQMRKHAR